jgi:2,4-dienoyl-CoA reductase-like NADH-dependent reductase (Old Yellow Enzyme family)
MSGEDIDWIVDDYRQAFRQARRAGFDVIELHCAHGYLLHSFLSSLANNRNDEYGGCLTNRMRLPLRLAAVMRESGLHTCPCSSGYRRSMESTSAGLSKVQSSFAKALKQVGVDLVDCSSGGMKPLMATHGYRAPPDFKSRSPKRSSARRNYQRLP